MPSPLPLVLELFAFVLGLLFGSFLNVCIARLPYGRSIVIPRSECPQCGARIRWYDNIPIVSWLVLGRRCRDCKVRIPWQYPLVELGYAVCFWWACRLLFNGYLAYEQFGQPVATWLWPAVTWIILGFLLIGLIVMDWQHHILPDAFTLSGIAIGFALVCVQAIFLPNGAGDITLNPAHSMRMSSPGSMVSQGNVFLTGPEALVFGRVVAIIAAGLLPWLVGAAYKALRKQQGLGLGDVKLLAMIAAFLGFWPAMLALFAGLVFCLPYALWLLARRRADGLTALPFGSFLAAGGLVAALAAGPILTWYRSLL